MDFLDGLWNGLYETISKVLPSSPFQPYIKEFANLPFLNYLNWFVPVKDILIVMATYLTAVGLYYVYSIVLRWIKALE